MPDPATLHAQAAAIRARAAADPPAWVAASAIGRWRMSLRAIADEVDAVAYEAENTAAEGACHVSR